MKKILKQIRNHYLVIIIYIIVILACIIKLPYYVDFPGGMMDISNKIVMNDEKKLSGTINLTYVSEVHATLPIIIYSYFNKDYKILSKNDIKYDDETLKEASIRDRLMIKEAVNNAIYVAYTNALKDLEITKNNYYVSYNLNSNSELKIGDKIIKINNTTINNNEDIENILNSTDDNYVNVEVINDSKNYIRKVKKYIKDDKAYLGVTFINLFEYKLEENIKINISNNESGPSGGAMFALALYCNLIDDDITHGLSIAGTGTIDQEGNIGPVGGIEFKLKGAKKADIFFVPRNENYEEALNLKKKLNLKVKIIPISTFDEMIDILKNYK